MTFPAGRERNIALGVWGALAGIGGTLGVVAGGVLVDSLGWEWIFFVNVPVAILALVAAAAVRAPRAAAAGSGSFDLTGAVLGTAGLLALVYGVIRTDAAGWGSAEVLGPVRRGGRSCSARSSTPSRAPPIRSSRSGSSACAG